MEAFRKVPVPQNPFRVGLGIGIGFLLASCLAATTVDVKIQCIPMVSYSAGEQQELLAELKVLPASALMLRRAMQDYEAMRDADRACQSTAVPTAVPNS